VLLTGACCHLVKAVRESVAQRWQGAEAGVNASPWCCRSTADCCPWLRCTFMSFIADCL